MAPARRRHVVGGGGGGGAQLYLIFPIAKLEAQYLMT